MGIGSGVTVVIHLVNAAVVNNFPRASFGIRYIVAVIAAAVVVIVRVKQARNCLCCFVSGDAGQLDFYAKSLLFDSSCLSDRTTSFAGKQKRRVLSNQTKPAHKFLHI
jgi:hypothetical protein